MEGNFYDADGNRGVCLSSYVDQGSVESQRYYLSRRTIMEMLRDRGYAVPNTEIELSLEEFRSIYGQKPDPERFRIYTFLRSAPSKKILVILLACSVVKKKVIESLATELVHKDGVNRLILILQSPITNQAQKIVEHFSFKVEIFHITDLLVNITKHMLTPKYQILTKEEKQKLLTKYNLNEKQLPRMLQKDAIARYYGLEKGQVVKITYSGEITESHVTYRCVW